MTHFESDRVASNNVWHEQVRKSSTITNADQAQLALVFEQRTANLISYLNAASAHITRAKGDALRAQIRERLGLDDNLRPLTDESA